METSVLTEGVEDEESLEAGAVVRQLPASKSIFTVCLE